MEVCVDKKGTRHSTATGGRRGTAGREYGNRTDPLGRASRDSFSINGGGSLKCVPGFLTSLLLMLGAAAPRDMPSAMDWEWWWWWPAGALEDDFEKWEKKPLLTFDSSRCVAAGRESPVWALSGTLGDGCAFGRVGVVSEGW